MYNCQECEFTCKDFDTAQHHISFTGHTVKICMEQNHKGSKHR